MISNQTSNSILKMKQCQRAGKNTRWVIFDSANHFFKEYGKRFNSKTATTLLKNWKGNEEDAMNEEWEEIKKMPNKRWTRPCVISKEPALGCNSVVVFCFAEKPLRLAVELPVCRSHLIGCFPFGNYLLIMLNGKQNAKAVSCISNRCGWLPRR